MRKKNQFTLLPLDEEHKFEKEFVEFMKENFAVEKDTLERALENHNVNSIEEFSHAIACEAFPWNDKVIQEASFGEILQIGKVYLFKNSSIKDMKLELTKYLRDNIEFRANKIEEVGERMVMLLDEYNALSQYKYEYINHIPEYGGPVKDPYEPIPLPKFFPLVQVMSQEEKEHNAEKDLYDGINLDDPYDHTFDDI